MGSQIKVSSASGGGSVRGRGASLGSSRVGGGGFRPDIEGLRAVAIGLVLVYHAGVVEVFPGGFVGVDVFFVI
ncbi:MAG TPA: hypothetical protein VK054_00795, partial [Beutenbergiaceae bacterium]|nr:hypothetical protein [Beutenbergiaceae bacterium]